MSAHAVDARLREDQLRLGLWMFLATVTMLFAAFTSAYIVRRSGSDWQYVRVPSILWINTAILAASSIALETANRFGLRGQWNAAVAGCGAAVALGVAFLAGQVVAWRELIAAGVYLPTSPHSSFFCRRRWISAAPSGTFSAAFGCSCSRWSRCTDGRDFNGE